MLQKILKTLCLLSSVSTLSLASDVVKTFDDDNKNKKKFTVKGEFSFDENQLKELFGNLHIGEKSNHKKSRNGHGYNLKFSSKEEKEYLASHSSKVKLFQAKKEVKLPDEFSLTQYIYKIKDQKDIGACTGFSSAQAAEVRNNFETGRDFKLKNEDAALTDITNAIKKSYVQFSPQYIYQKERLLQGDLLGDDNGSTLTMASRVLCQFGVCTEKLNPYQDTLKAVQQNTTLAMDKEALKYTNNDGFSLHMIAQNQYDIMSALYANHPIIMGINIYGGDNGFESESTAEDGIVFTPDTDTDELLGGHAVALLGWKRLNDDNHNDELMGVFANSWGSGWGGTETILAGKESGGFFYLPMKDYILDPNLSDDFHGLGEIDKKN